jgi:hypothetical protein
MPDTLGQSVLKRKDKLALDPEKVLGHNVLMTEPDSKAQYEQEFIARVKAARIATGKKQWQVAELMGMPQDKYKQYETRSLLPHHMIGRFCLLTNVDPNWLLTGRGAKPLQPPYVVAEEAPAIRRPKKNKRPRAA